MKWGVFGSIIAILVLTVLEFPAPIGFETRPQGDVSLLWLGLFLVILFSEVLALVLIFKWPRLGAILAIEAAGLNIIQVIADQMHLLQPEVASLGYSILEYAVAAVSLLLIYFALKVNALNKKSN